MGFNPLLVIALNPFRRGATTALTYPDGRVLSYDYGTTDGINDAVSRVGSLIDDGLQIH